MPAQTARADDKAAFKEIFDEGCAAWIGDGLKAAWPDFDRDRFVAEATADLPALSLKERVERFAATAVALLPADPLPIIVRALSPEQPPKSDEDFGDFRVMAHARMVSLAGLDTPEAGLDALEAVTKRFTAEFDIRPFLVRHPALTLERLHAWAQHPDWRVRRLASEGSRPRLPWGLRLQEFVRDPTPVLAVLERLYRDPNSAVRRSVANNLNDIAKDHPASVVETLSRWHSERPLADSFLRHALRTLIKQGHQGALALVGIDCGAQAAVLGFSIEPTTMIGGSIGFSASLTNDGTAAATFSVDYAVHYRRADGGVGPKIFKLSRPRLAAGESCQVAKRHSLKPVTIRVLRPGLHRIELLVNGKVAASGAFELLP